MYNILKSVGIFFILISFLTTNIYASQKSNRDELLDTIRLMSTDFEGLMTNKRKLLEDRVVDLSNKFDESFKDTNIDQKTIDFLTSMGKISSNFKRDLTLEYNNLYGEIGTKINNEITLLSNLRNNIVLNYSSVSNSQKQEIATQLERFENSFIDLKNDFTQKINNLSNKYSGNIESYKTNLRNVVNQNSSSIDLLTSFSNSFNDLVQLHDEFQKNYKIFSDSYLSYAGELTSYASQKEEEYVKEFSKRIDTLINTNLEANPRLQDYIADINRFRRILEDNFANNLNIHLRDNFGLLYSETDINSVIGGYNNLKNRYFDASNNIRTQEVLTTTGSLSQINNIKENLDSVNNRLKSIISDNPDLNTLGNIKIRLENIIIRFYNDSYPEYRDDIMGKLREKMNLISLETRNIVTISEIIDIRYTMLSDNIIGARDMDEVKRQIANFNSFTNRYRALNDSNLNAKIDRLDNSLKIYVVDRKLAANEFRQFRSSRDALERDINNILNQIERRFPDSYNDKFDIVLSRIDTALKLNINNQTKHMLLMVERTIYSFLSK